MASDKLIEDGDNIYYVDSTSAMVANTWVKVVSEDQDNAHIEEVSSSDLRKETNNQ